jgi:tetratricopeptide (TPR) repeat protein
LRLDDLVLSVVADHGEALGEHGESTHGALLYESTLRVPWLIRLPRGRLGGVEVEAPVRTLDVAPTLLGLLNASPLEDVDGVDLSPFLEKGTVPDLAVQSESLYLHLLLGWNELRSLRRGSLKLVGLSQPALYDLARDPGETMNRIEERQSDARRLLSELRESVRATPPSAAAEGERTAERLASLGYVSGATRNEGEGRDPRDGMAIWREIESGTSLLLRDRTSARSHFERALELDPENGLVLKSLGDVALAEGQAAPALEHYRRAAANGFEHPDLELGLARALAALGEIDEAHEQVERFLAARPDNGDGLLLRGRLLRARGRTAEAEAELRQALAAMPGDASALNELGSVLAEQGRRDEARGLFEQAMAAGPEATEPRRNLALLLEGSEAERLRREAIRLDPSYAEARIDLARQLAESGRAAEAETEIEAALRLRPDDPEALFIAARVAELAGRPERARGYYERFLSLAPKELAEPREIARRRLEALRGNP